MNLNTREAPQARKIASSIGMILSLLLLIGSLNSAHAQTAVTLSPVARQQFLAADGTPLANGCIFTYSSGTSTPAATYTDQTGMYQASNPIILDGGGFATIWITSRSYRFVLVSNGGVNCGTGSQQWLIDGVSPPPFLAGNNAFTGNNTFSGTSIFNGAVTISNGGTLTGNFAGSPNFTGSPTFTGGFTVSTVAPNFGVAPNFTSGINTDAINGTLTSGSGAQLQMFGATGAPSKNGENIEIFGGVGGSGAPGGDAVLSSGLGGAGSNGGIARVQAGDGGAGNTTGGIIQIFAGAGSGSGDGGPIFLTAGTAGPTGFGGDVFITPGPGGVPATNGSAIIANGRIIFGQASAGSSCAATNIGDTGTCNATTQRDSDPIIALNVSGASIGTSGTVTYTFQRSMGANGAHCTATLSDANTAPWDPRASVHIAGESSSVEILNWDNNSVALTAGLAYNINLHCYGDN